MQYLLSVHGRRDINPYDSDEDMHAAFERVGVFNQSLQDRGHWVLAGGLVPPEDARTILPDGSVVDGPYLDADTFPSGFWIIEADSEETALNLATEAAALRPRPNGDPVMFATKTAMRMLGRRVLALDDEKAELDALLSRLVADTAPGLLAVYGVGVDTAAILLVAAGDNADRVHSEAAWANLCGVAPLPATSGKKTDRHRLNRGGNRQANHALWRIVFTRMSSDPRTRTYLARRLNEGLSKPEIMRVLKRYVARETYRHLPMT